VEDEISRQSSDSEDLQQGSEHAPTQHPAGGLGMTDEESLQEEELWEEELREEEESRQEDLQWLFIIFVLLNMADVSLTWLGLRSGLVEQNRLAAAAFATIGFWPSAALKLGIIALVWKLLMRRLSGPRQMYFAFLANGIMAALVVWNAIKLFFPGFHFALGPFSFS